jgi:hypothetical protein
MRNRRQVVEFSDCLLARNAGLRLQENNRRASSEIVFNFWGPTAGSNGGSSECWSFGGRRLNFPTSRTGVRVGGTFKTRWGTQTRELVSSANGIG